MERLGNGTASQNFPLSEMLTAPLQINHHKLGSGRGRVEESSEKLIMLTSGNTSADFVASMSLLRNVCGVGQHLI